MTKHTSLAIALTATTFLCTPAVASSLTPTLDALKSEAGSVLPSVNQTYNLSELSGDLPTGAVKVEIGGKDYYFMPSGDNAGLLTTLAGTSAGMLKESSDGLFELDGKKYGFDVASIPDSAFSYSEGSEDDYNFSMSEADAEGKLTTQYYKIDLKPEAFATSKNISWTAVSEDQKDAADVVAVQLPNDQTKYFKYTYTRVPDRTIYNTPQNSLSGDVNADFIGSFNESNGGAIRNINTSIDNITGDFIGNSTGSDYGHGGAIYINNGKVNNITGDFIGNSLNGNYANGGAIHNSFHSIIGNISGDFISNFSQHYGGAIYNDGSSIGKINSNFIGNYVYNFDEHSSVYGGAIYNVGTIGDITGDFIGNYVSSSGSYTYGGAVSNSDSGIIGNITGDFIGNITKRYGAAIYNKDHSLIGNITGNFIGNKMAESSADGSGVAIYNDYSAIKNINGNFINNTSTNASGSWGVAIFNSGGNIGNISGDFIGNYAAFNTGYTYGAAIYTAGELGNVKGNFISNYIQSTQSVAYGGAIYASGTVGNITGDFIQNHAEGEWAVGGAIYNTVTTVITGNLIDNYAKGSSSAKGGAVYNSGNITLSSTGNTHFFSGNYTQNKSGKIYNAITNAGSLTFATKKNGVWVINDSIESDNDDMMMHNSSVLSFTGDGSGTIWINNDIVNAAKVTVDNTILKFGAYQHDDRTAKNWDGKGAFVGALKEDGTANRDADAVTVLSLNNAVFDLANGYQDVVKLRGYSATDSFMHIDVDTDNMSADMLNVNGNVEGVTKLIVHASSDADIRGKGEILFAESENDTTGNEGSFVVSRVYKSPYLFDINYTQRAENSNQWGLTMNEEENPDKYVEPEEPDVPDVPTPPTPELPDIPVKPTPSVDYRKVAPEVIAYQGLPVAALEQTKGMVGNIGRQVQGRRFYCPGCGFYDSYWNGQAFNTLWANAVYQTSENEALVNVDADVWGIEAGSDLQHDLNNKLGLFVSYRKGNYDLNGKGKYYYSTVGSEIDIDSYLAGLYYRYDRNNWWTFATVYGGIQKADLKTKDGIKSDTDGTEFGGSVELGYDYNLSKTLYLTPSIGAFYTQVDYDDATDSAGKIAKYNTLRQLELEAGVKLTKAFVTDEGYANVYVKPSVVRTITDGDEVRITGLRKVDTIDDQTLGRVELGGRYGFTEQLSAYGWANHTFGDDYKASTFGLGLSYSW